MGILSSHLHLLAMEQKKHPIKGDVLTLGQQAIYGTIDEVKKIFAQHGVIPKELPVEFDTKSKLPGYEDSPRGKFTNVQSVLTLLGAGRVFVADISDYERADYIIDLNEDVEEKFYEKFDFILDSGTLEHVFNTPKALANVIKMLKKGGRVMFILPCSGAINHGFYSFNPNIFYDFFSANGFSDFSCYLLEESSFNVYRKSKIYKYNYIFSTDELPLRTKKTVEICFCATKKSDTNISKIRIPIQGMYLDFDWGKKQPVSMARKKSRFEFLHAIKRKIDFSSRKWRPEFIDILYKNPRRKKNLNYLGKF